MPSTPLQEKRSVLQVLQSFQGTAPLRELLAHLNYDPVNDPIARTDWKDDERTLLAADPRVLGKAAGEFSVIYSQMVSTDLRRTEERLVITRLLKQFPYALFVFSNKAQSEFHFVNVKWETGAKRRVFRRIAVGRHERLRTAVERISMLDVETIDKGLFALTPQQVQDRHDQAFDVSKVTKDFYTEYKRVFEAMRASIRGFGPSEAEQDRKHLFTQRLFNRLMFLRFIQKKGWLTIDGDPDYLAALWRSHRRLKQDGKNFFADRLKLLFAALNDERAGEIILKGRGGAVEQTIGKVKYLNGGLFEETPEDKDEKVKIPDVAFAEVFDPEKGLFERFNFTIMESTPLDEEIAVDPEMLGKIFEELVTGRHESGSYYTPKPIVSFMCREALKGYLETQVATEKKEALARFVDKHEPDDIRDAEAVLNALRRVTVCDPACGSGAYLLGMMHELLDLRQCLFQTRKVDNKTMYQRKLDVIQTNVYGVDIAEFAVNIARLRLWLSLAVDYDGPEPQPLPNLDYKIEVGDSICSPSPGALQMGLQKPLVDEFLEVKKRYLLAHHGEKPVLRAQVEELRKQIMDFSQREATEFDWVINFAEVFQNEGFDVVLANPPYVRQEKIKHIKPELKRRFPADYSGTADLYTYFYLRGIEMLRQGGMLSYITSNKWLRADYGGPLRKRMGESVQLMSITDFGELPVFETASTFPMILVACKEKPDTAQTFRFTQVKSLEQPYPDVRAIQDASGFSLSNEATIGRDWRLVDPERARLMKIMEASGIPLAKYVDGKIYRGILTGFNEAFVIDAATRARLIKEDPKSKEIIFPMAKGDDVRRWRIEDRGRWMIVTKIGLDMKRYPAVFKHLKQWKDELEARQDQGDHWWELRACAYYEAFSVPKLVFPEIAKERRFAFDERKTYVNNKAFLIPSDDLYLLGVLNSSSAWAYTRSICAALGDGEESGRVMLQWVNFQKLPIPVATDAQKRPIVECVRRCLDRAGADCEELEAEIDRLVARLYGLEV